MQLFSRSDWRGHGALAGLLIIATIQLTPLTSYAQNLGQQPATGQAVQGQTAAQPEGAVLNAVNWVGNVIAPVGARCPDGTVTLRDPTSPRTPCVRRDP